MNSQEKKEHNFTNEDNYFFSPMTAQRRELRKLWNDAENKGVDWEVFLYDSEMKILKISDALKLSYHQISITYGITELLEIYNTLYNTMKTENTIINEAQNNALNNVIQEVH